MDSDNTTESMSIQNLPTNKNERYFEILKRRFESLGKWIPIHSNNSNNNILEHMLEKRKNNATNQTAIAKIDKNILEREPKILNSYNE